MDAVTHGLASYALARAAFPRASSIIIVGAIFAGCAADIDSFSAQFGPAAFLNWHRTYLHSISAALFIAIVISAVLITVFRSKPLNDTPATIFLAVFGACLLHLAMDFCQNDAVSLFWPFRAHRYSADLLARFDLVILLLLLAGVLLPWLFGLVTEEIGAKSKAPRGRVGAAIALLLLVAYIGARFILHGNALALMQAHTYRGESPRKIAALAEPGSPLRWRGIAETERALHDVDVNLGLGSSFDLNAGIVSYKPENSPPLEAAQNTATVQHFLQAVRFPKASVEKTPDGYRVEIRDFTYQRNPASGLRVLAVVVTDANARLINQQFAWLPREK